MRTLRSQAYSFIDHQKNAHLLGQRDLYIYKRYVYTLSLSSLGVELQILLDCWSWYQISSSRCVKVDIIYYPHNILLLPHSFDCLLWTSNVSKLFHSGICKKEPKVLPINKIERSNFLFKQFLFTSIFFIVLAYETQKEKQKYNYKYSCIHPLLLFLLPSLPIFF